MLTSSAADYKNKFWILNCEENVNVSFFKAKINFEPSSVKILISFESTK